MPRLLCTLAFAISVIGAIPSASDSSGDRRDEGGFTIPAFKRDLGSPLRKRANLVATNERWWITLGIGTPPQDLNFLPDSGANDFSMQSTLMPENQRGNGFFFDPSKSSTAKVMQDFTYSEAFASGYSDSGLVYTDTINLGSGVFADVPILLVTNASSPSNNDRTGNLGLDPDSGGQSTKPKRVPTFMQKIRPNLPKGIVTMMYNSYTSTGELDFGFVNASKFVGDLVFVKNKAGSTEWEVQFDGMVVNGTLKKLPFTAIVDSGTGGGSLPRGALDAYFAQVPAASFSTSANTFVYPCDTILPDMVFSVGGLALRIPSESWIGDPVGNSNNCACGFAAGDGFLGEIFIEGAFVVFDFDNLQVGFANRPARSTVIPAPRLAGHTTFCTGTNFEETCQNVTWASNECRQLHNTSFCRNVGSFKPSHGSCTLYHDTSCGSPIPDLTNVRQPGKTDAGISGRSADSYMCLWPTDYAPQNKGTMQVCSGIGFRGDCQVLQWNSYVCNPLPAKASKNIASARPSAGYCYWFTDVGCTQAVEDGAPMPSGGSTMLAFGRTVQSYLCI